MITIKLSEQDLAEFLEDIPVAMEAYRAKLQRLLTVHFGQTNVEITDTLVDVFHHDDNIDRNEIHHIMNSMLDDWGWLK